MIKHLDANGRREFSVITDTRQAWLRSSHPRGFAGLYFVQSSIFGRIMKLGFQPVNLTLQFYANPTRPPGTSPWEMRMQIAFLFPKLTKEQQKMLMEQKLKQMEQEQQKPPAKQ